MPPTTTSELAGARATMDLRLIARHGERISAARAAESQAIDDVAREVLRARACGGRGNVSLAAKLAGLSRDTVYARIAALESQENTHA